MTPWALQGPGPRPKPLEGPGPGPGPLRASLWPFVGQALVGRPPVELLSPCGPPWALAGWALVGRALVGPFGPSWDTYIYIYIHMFNIYIYICIYMYIHKT